MRRGRRRREREKEKRTRCGDQNLVGATQTTIKTPPEVNALKTMFSTRLLQGTTN
jgi:hypothetical protein